MKATYFAAVALVAVFLLSSGGLLFANVSAYSFHGKDSNRNYTSYQPVNLSFGGIIANAGNQTYRIGQSGWVDAATILGMNLAPEQTHINYRLYAMVQGLLVGGSAHFHLAGVTADGSENVAVNGNAEIVDMVPALCLPSYSTSGTCGSKDTSAVPAFFVGISNISVSMTPTSKLGIIDQAPMMMQNVPMLFESAYLNPFGASIAFGTAADNFAKMLVVTPYSRASIDWHGVVVTGVVSGTSGGTPIAGEFLQVTFEQENLVTGLAFDHGLMSFTNMVNTNNGKPMTSLDVAGHFEGLSLIPTTPSYECLTNEGNLGQCSNSDCSQSIGFPANSGLCTNTGFESMGTFNLQGLDSRVNGAYYTAWSSPAFAFAAFANGAQTDPSEMDLG